MLAIEVGDPYFLWHGSKEEKILDRSTKRILQKDVRMRILQLSEFGTSPKTRGLGPPGVPEVSKK